LPNISRLVSARIHQPYTEVLILIDLSRIGKGYRAWRCASNSQETKFGLIYRNRALFTFQLTLL
jgi:hypothetical protein